MQTPANPRMTARQLDSQFEGDSQTRVARAEGTDLMLANGSVRLKEYQISTAGRIRMRAANEMMVFIHNGFAQMDMRVGKRRFSGPIANGMSVVLPPYQEAQFDWSVRQCDTLQILALTIAHPALLRRRTVRTTGDLPCLSESGLPVQATLTVHAQAAEPAPQLAAMLTSLNLEARRGNPLGNGVLEQMYESIEHYLVHTHCSFSLVNAKARAPSKPLAPDVLVLVERHIQDRLHQTIAVEQLAALAGLSKFHFIRAYREATGRTPYERVLELRVRRAKELIEHAPKGVLSEIAQQVGFCDQGHLYRHFKRVLGVTPAQFQTQVHALKES